MFFEDYTEKLWGIHPSQISSDWGAQRVKGLSIIKILKNWLLKPFISKKDVETSLIEEFIYPKFGPGQFYEAVAKKIENLGGTILLNKKVIKLSVNQEKNIKNITVLNEKNEEETIDCESVFSSMPIKDLFISMDNVEKEVLEIAQNLQYRDFITVGLLVRKFAIKNTSKYETISDIIPDCWIYIQDRNVKLGRLQIFNNWSPYLVQDLENTVWLGLEYFCTEGDKMWSEKNDEFMKFAIDELSSLGIITKEDVLDSTIVRVKKAYPAYFGVYKDFDKVKEYLNTITNLYCIGRNGQHRYNNMDHSILTGFEAARAYINKTNKDNIWAVNTEQTYHEKSC